MSTEHQQYSILNQSAAIALYAAAHDLGIVRSFVDEGRASTCLRIGSKLRCILSTPTEMQSISENDFECFARTGVKTAVTQKVTFSLNAP